MAAIGRRTITAGLAVAAASMVLRGEGDDQSSDARAVFSQIAQALSAGNFTDAIEPFSRRYAERDKLKDCFESLTNSYTIVNEVDVTDEQDAPEQVTMTLKWSLTLGEAGQRTAEINAKLAREKNRWKITEFAPIDLFDPQQALKK